MNPPATRAAGGSRPLRPEWLKIRAGGGPHFAAVKQVVREEKLHTVCEEARCPNIGECWGHGTATFMILGDTCTRGCRYCAVNKGMPTELDLEEPARLADAVVRMGLSYVVITSVDRDDLADGGAAVFADCVREIRARSPGTTVEVLIPDFQGSPAALGAVLDAGPDVLNHNVETVPRLYRSARGGGVYETTLELLDRARRWAPGIVTKTGMMLGLGEEDAEVLPVMRDLVERGVDILTLGQYLRPSEWHLPVARFVHPDEFAELARLGEAMGFAHVEAGPLVRSSYRADRQLLKSRLAQGAAAVVARAG
ncbi:MAG TPA: lipoyl synthase [Gemmatimonadota bacterium]|nr:lipoyl synthase [Gemmatimonadota bacterium]